MVCVRHTKRQPPTEAEKRIPLLQAARLTAKSLWTAKDKLF
jgi:hypothetical protein